MHKEFFAAVTDRLDALLGKCTPCAQLLYRWVLRRKKPGMEYELDLREFAAYSEQARKKANPYNKRHIRRAFDELVEQGLIEVVKSYWPNANIFKIIARSAKMIFSSPEGKDLSEEGQEKFQDRGSNPDATGIVNRERSNTVNTVAVGQNAVDPNQSHYELDQPADPSLNRTIVDKDQFSAASDDREILQKASEAIAPEPLNPQLTQLVIHAERQVVLNAVAALLEVKQTRVVNNPGGFLRRAIEGRWKPNVSGPVIPPGFGQWFERMRSAGLLQATEMKDGVIYCCTDDGWISYEAFVQKHGI